MIYKLDTIINDLKLVGVLHWYKQGNFTTLCVYENSYLKFSKNYSLDEGEGHDNICLPF